ncbi:TetR/AcrR family transcriptional regulator [Paenibacillus piri]|uniref:TetR/AcrR family transcriptional regulator n=1 Tax=Paenibacillus piri TaxID=2547395 RepID=A0A4R5KBK5_9BACL|nr:TetR/AcrR family transcriptional regulator [Paenibacillus piri]TDF92593.1 TetR/AcrR family transcriptional regulator [Paenibacillus piri]
MNDKKLQIIRAAIKLFGARDYHTTSVQDIVSLAGVSKGAFYLHFHSKEELLIAVFTHYMDWLRSQLSKTQSDQALTAREKLIKAVEFNYQYIMGDQDFLSMHLKGFSFLNSSVKELMIANSMESTRWMEQRILELYGPAIEEHSFDCANLLNGMLREYFFYFVIYGLPIEIRQLSEYLMNRLDDIVHGIMSRPTIPILTSSFVFPDQNPVLTKETWIEKAHSIRDWIEAHAGDSKAAEVMLQSLDAVIQEVNKEQPNDIIIKGMHSYMISLAQCDPDITARLEALFNEQGAV